MKEKILSECCKAKIIKTTDSGVYVGDEITICSKCKALVFFDGTMAEPRRIKKEKND